MRLGLLAAALALVPCIAGAGDMTLTDSPFWKLNAGWWLSDNTYFAPSMDYNIRAYNSLTHVEVDGSRVRETEYKFYSPSKLSVAGGAGEVGPDEGLEVVTVTEAEATSPNGSARYINPKTGAPLADGSRIDVLTSDSAMRVVPGPKADEYRMLITLPTNDRRYLSNLGIVDRDGDPHGAVGDLRGFSLFRAKRVPAGDFERLRAELRTANKVAAVSELRPDGTRVVTRLGAK